MGPDGRHHSEIPKKKRKEQMRREEERRQTDELNGRDGRSY